MSHMDKLGAHLATIKDRIEIVGADHATRFGFTQVPNFILTNNKISRRRQAGLRHAAQIRLVTTTPAFPASRSWRRTWGQGSAACAATSDELRGRRLPGGQAARPRQDQPLPAAPDREEAGMMWQFQTGQYWPVWSGHNYRSRAAEFAGHSI